MAARRLRFETYQSKRNNEWRWRLYGKNGKIVADSGESYKNKAACLKAVRTIVAFAHQAVHEVKDKTGTLILREGMY